MGHVFAISVLVDKTSSFYNNHPTELLYLVASKTWCYYIFSEAKFNHQQLVFLLVMNESELKAFETRCSGELEPIPRVAVVMLHGISALLSIFGNVLVLLAVYRTRRLQKVSNYFICSLAAADLSVGLIANPLWLAKAALNAWHNRHMVSKAAEFMAMQAIITTTFNLVAVSIDRYTAITRVYQYSDIITTRRCIYAVVFIWGFSLLFGSMRLILHNPYELPKLWTSATIIGIFTPLMIIAFCQFRIFQEARVQLKNIRTQNAALDSKDVREVVKNRKAATTIAIIIGLYISLWCPSLAIAGVQMLTTDLCLKLQINCIWFWAAVLNFSNSAFNPWVYSIRCDDFKTAFKKLLGLRVSNFANKKLKSQPVKSSA